MVAESNHFAISLLALFSECLKNLAKILVKDYTTELFSGL